MPTSTGDRNLPACAFPVHLINHISSWFDVSDNAFISSALSRCVRWVEGR